MKEVKQEKNMGYLEPQHIENIFSAYEQFSGQDNFATLVNTKDVLAKNANMAINLYIRPDSLSGKAEASFSDIYEQWQQSSCGLKSSMEKLFKELG